MGRDRYIQCSMCFQFYSFNEFLRLESEWIDPKNKKKYGKQAICKCGARFHKNKWHIESRKDNYIISTVHLEIGVTSNWSDVSDDYFYETMIFPIKDLGNHKYEFGNPLEFQMRYKTMEEAIQGHKDTYDRLENILLDPGKYPTDIISLFTNAFKASDAQRKVIQHDVKERLK